MSDGTTSKGIPQKRAKNSTDELSIVEKNVLDIMTQKGLARKEVEQKVKEYYGLNIKDMPCISDKNGSGVAPFVLAWLLTIHETLVDHDGVLSIEPIEKKPGVTAAAKQIVEQLDEKSMQAALMQLMNRNLHTTVSIHKMKRYLAYPICRYADEKSMRYLLETVARWGGSVPVDVIRQACLYNEQSTVTFFADEFGDLDQYALIRGTDAQHIRDTIMTECGLDADGKKVYDLGKTTVAVMLNTNVSLDLVDCTKNKIIKSIPKRGNDEQLVELAKNDFADLSSQVKRAIQNRVDQLFSDFLSGKEHRAECWKNAYLNKILLKRIAEIIVWKQGKQTYILKDGNPIKWDGTPYVFTEEPIQVAHPIEMDEQEVRAWQGYFADNHLKQPFEQIWEPVIDPKDISEDRYAGIGIPYYRFWNAKKHGITVNYGYIEFDGCVAQVDCIDSAYYVQRNDRLEIKNIRFESEIYNRQKNHIIAFIDKITVCERILKDDVTVIRSLHNFTLAQILSFIGVATENKCTNVTAALLEYKKEHFPEADPMAEFVLEW